MLNTRTLSIKDARSQMSWLIEEVAIARKSFIITKFGKPKAAVIPLDQDVSQKFGLSSAFGLWEYRKDIKDSGKWVTKMRNKWSKRA